MKRAVLKLVLFPREMRFNSHQSYQTCSWIITFRQLSKRSQYWGHSSVSCTESLIFANDYVLVVTQRQHVQLPACTPQYAPSGVWWVQCTIPLTCNPPRRIHNLRRRETGSNSRIRMRHWAACVGPEEGRVPYVGAHGNRAGGNCRRHHACGLAGVATGRM